MADTKERIGAYEVVRLIARGGMATVYEAYQPALDRPVALKRLDLRSTDPMQAERFVMESRVSASFNHPNIVTVFDFFEHDGVPYIAMEYLPRGSLRGCVTRLAPAQVFGVLEGVLKGLAHAQESGVAHRDLKPENVLITRTGSVKIADFGIAKAYHSAAVRLSATGIAMGTPAYMAPEQAMAQPVGPYTDLYAVGVMTYEMFSGGPPFQGDESPMSVMYRHVSEPPPPLTGVDPRLAAWVARLLEEAPAHRPAGAKEAWDELEPTVVDLLGPFWRNDSTLGEIPKEEYVTVVGGEAVPLESPEEPETLVAPEPETRVAPEPETPVAPRGPARRGLIAGLAAVGVAAVATVVALSAGGSPGGGERASPQPPANRDAARPVKAAAPYDFDGDGTATPVVGMPTRRSGAVRVGFDAAPLTMPGAARFGAAAASADFNRDGKADLAVGAPGSNTVAVFAGSASGLSREPSRLTGRGRFGAALAAGDIDGDGYGDLVVGAPRGRGTVAVMRGGSAGLSADDPRELRRPTRARRGFGTLLALGDLNRDGRLDLAEGAPGHSTYCLSGDRGLGSCRVLASDHGPAALAVADVTGDRLGDIVQGHPDAGDEAPVQFGTAPGPAGQVEVWPARRSGVARRPYVLTEDTTGVAGGSQALDEFGASIALADLDRDGRADLVIGAPGEDAGLGRVTIVPGGPGGHGRTQIRGYDGRGSPSDLPISVTPGSRYGEAIQLLDTDGDGRLDLVGSVPGSGYVVTLRGTKDGLFTRTGGDSIRLPDGVSTVTLGASTP